MPAHSFAADDAKPASSKPGEDEADAPVLRGVEKRRCRFPGLLEDLLEKRPKELKRANGTIPLLLPELTVTRAVLLPQSARLPNQGPSSWAQPGGDIPALAQAIPADKIVYWLPGEHQPGAAIAVATVLQPLSCGPLAVTGNAAAAGDFSLRPAPENGAAPARPDLLPTSIDRDFFVQPPPEDGAAPTKPELLPSVQLPPGTIPDGGSVETPAAIAAVPLEEGSPRPTLGRAAVVAFAARLTPRAEPRTELEPGFARPAVDGPGPAGNAPPPETRPPVSASEPGPPPSHPQAKAADPARTRPLTGTPPGPPADPAVQIEGNGAVGVPVPPADFRPAGKAPETTPEPAQVRVEAPAPPEAAPATAPARQIHLQLSTGERRVDVQLSERSGTVHVAVRTPDSLLAGALRQDLRALSGRLEQSGFRTEIWQPAASSSEAHFRAAETYSGENFPGGRHAPGNGGEPPGERQPKPQPERLAAGNPSRKEFAWLLSSLG